MNVPKEVTTYCPKCNEKLIERCGFEVLEYKIANGKCPKCGKKLSLIPTVVQVNAAE